MIVVETPGVHTQLDVKHLPHLLPKNEKCYVYNFVDHASRWEFKRAFDSYEPLNTRILFEELLTRIPFGIECSQTDNGVEFTNKFVSNADNLAPHAFDLNDLLDEHCKFRNSQ